MGYIMSQSPVPVEPPAQYVQQQMPMHMIGQSPQPMQPPAQYVVSQSPQPMQPPVQYVMAGQSPQPMQAPVQYVASSSMGGSKDYSAYLTAPQGSWLTDEQCHQLGVPSGTRWGPTGGAQMVGYDGYDQ